MQRDRNKRPYNPCVMSGKCPCSMCSPLGPGLDILCNPALCCKSRLVPVRASFLRRRLFAECLCRIRRHLSPACPERLELGYAIRMPGTPLQSQRSIRSISRLSSRLTALLCSLTYALSRPRGAAERVVRWPIGIHLLLEPKSEVYIRPRRFRPWTNVSKERLLSFFLSEKAVRSSASSARAAFTASLTIWGTVARFRVSIITLSLYKRHNVMMLSSHLIPKFSRAAVLA